MHTIFEDRALISDPLIKTMLFYFSGKEEVEILYLDLPALWHVSEYWWLFLPL